MEEHRAAPRHRVLKAGTMEFGGSKVECLIRNISTTGAAVEVKSPLWFPDAFALVVNSDGISRHCHIVWRNAMRLGVAFDD